MFMDLLSQLPFDGSMLGILAAFVILYWIAKTFFFVPILDLLEERAREIETAEDAFLGARADVEAELEEQRAKMAAERGEARAERDAIRREALAAREAMVKETQAMTEEKLEAARQELEQVVATERAQLESKAADLAGQMANKILRKAS